MNVENFKSSKGNTIPNQFIIRDVFIKIPSEKLIGHYHEIKGYMYQSYEAIILFKSYTGKVYLDSKYWNYSRTTGKYRNLFLHETIAETRKKIESGEYKLIDLNK